MSVGITKTSNLRGSRAAHASGWHRHAAFPHVLREFVTLHACFFEPWHVFLYDMLFFCVPDPEIGKCWRKSGNLSV